VITSGKTSIRVHRDAEGKMWFGVDNKAPSTP